MSREYRYHENAGSNPLGWVAILGGGYILLRVMGIDPIAMIEQAFGIGTGSTTPAAGTVTTGTTPQANNPGQSTTTTPPPINTTQSSVPSIDPNSVEGKILAMVSGGSMTANPLLTADAWNYYYQLVRGIPGPDPLVMFPNDPRTKTRSIQEWWSALSSQGFSGFSGLGVVANISPYVGGAFNTHKGQGLPLLGSEMFAKYLYGN